MVWARIKDDTLSIYSFKVIDGGRSDVQAYHRTLDGDNMKLQFIRYVDGKVVKETIGKMRRDGK